MNQLNGNNSNGDHKNGAKLENQQVLTLADSKASKPLSNPSKYYQENSFEQSVVLRQSPVWSRAIMISLIGLACFGITWTYFAKIEQVVPATGQLKPEGTVKEIQAPVNGVVKAVYVKDGKKVKSGELLLDFDSTANNAELDSLNKIRASLIQEIQIYRNLFASTSPVAADVELLRGNLPKEAAFLLKNRAALVAENELLRKELQNSLSDIKMGVDEKQRLDAAKRELDSRSTAAQMEIEQIRKRLSQNQIQISDAQASLAIESKILEKMKTLSEEGAIAQLQYLQQQQKVQNNSAQIAQLMEENQRLKFDIEQGQEELKNTVAASEKNILEKISDNKNKIADIDSQLTRILLENEKQLAEVNSKISQTRLNAKYQNLRAPVAGTVFDLQAKNPGFVANASQELLKIVPNDSYIAEVFITNKDIGFVREGMKVDVRIDSFPFSEFGDIKGTVAWIGSDALPPDQTHPYYRFPAKINLHQQSLDIKGKTIPLQSGMSISANIKVREERTVMSLFTELFTKQIESLKEVR
jgi:hemolysin D